MDGGLRSGRPDSATRLEPSVEADAEELYPVLDDMRLHAFVGGTPPTLAQLRGRLSRWEARQSPDRREVWWNWTVRLVDGGAAVGYVQATVVDDAAYLAYVVGTDWSGQGIASEAVAEMIGLLVQLGVVRFRARIHPGHAASAAVARHVRLVATGEIDADGEELWSRDDDISGQALHQTPPARVGCAG